MEEKKVRFRNWFQDKFEFRKVGRFLKGRYLFYFFGGLISKFREGVNVNVDSMKFQFVHIDNFLLILQVTFLGGGGKGEFQMFFLLLRLSTNAEGCESLSLFHLEILPFYPCRLEKALSEKCR